MRMLYDCDNVRTVTYGARLNTPPMKAFRAPGFVEGTFGLECLIDELAAKLDVDPLELRRRNARYGLATLCVGVGQGQAALFERTAGG